MKEKMERLNKEIFEILNNLKPPVIRYSSTYDLTHILSEKFQSLYNSMRDAFSTELKKTISNNNVDTLVEFLTTHSALEIVKSYGQANLMIANNVLAHVPDINDFIKGVKLALKPNGVNTFEFPHICKLVQYNQFDTIYHEHFSYLSFGTVINIFAKNGLNVFDVEDIGTHGGSLRVYAQPSDSGSHLVSSRVDDLLSRETSAGMSSIVFYQGFQEHAEKVKNEFLSFLI